MQEQLLHFIWQRKLFNHSDLFTTQGQQVEIIHPGFPNQDQGPDFLQARIKIEDSLWAGHVEIHIRSSAWFLHTHDQDSHYNNVVLHVVWEEDEPAVTLEKIRIPCIELHKRVEKELLARYSKLMNNQEWVPCASSLSSVDQIIKVSWLERLMSERLEKKTEQIHQILMRCGNDYEQAFFVLLCRHLGSPSNSDAMENMGIKVPLNILRKHGDRIDQIEAILFGVAGMLVKEINTEYPLKLKREFDFLKAKYNLSVIPSLQWKFMRMRPVHFPTIRIAQLSVLISQSSHFITLLAENNNSDAWMKKFMVKPANDYWNDHYHFKSQSPFLEKKLGKDTAVSLIINVVVPFMFFYGKMQGLNHLKEKAIQMLCELPAERNAIIKAWEENGWNAKDAGHTQALLHLKKYYCDLRRCLNCAVGMQVLR
ncbi:MAG TPA: DUF2851 family protein [Saprospiraceae bacterium]|nr:DUF2851 family protein [Saprospiraceae bacterium]